LPRGNLVGQAIRRTHLASNLGKGEALSEDVRSNVLKASAVMGQFAEVVAENLFVKVAKKMERLDRNIGSLQLALEQAPEVFETIGVNLSVNVLFGMVDHLMLETMILESLIGHERVGVDRATGLDVSANIGLQGMFLAIANDSGANLATTLQNAHDGGLVFGASLSNPALALISVHEASRTANESFVYFNLAIGTTEFEERAILHCQTNAVEHEPCALLSDAKSATNLIGTDAVLAIGNHPNSDEPLVQTNRRILENSPDLHAKLALGMNALALPFVLILEEHGILAATSGAGNDAIGPANLDHELQAVLRAGEVQHGLLESLWLGAHVVPHKPNVSKVV